MPDGSEPHIEDPAVPSPEDDRVARLLARTIDVPVLAEAVERQEAADAADTLEHLEEEAAGVLAAMEENAAAEALAEMESPLAVSVIDDLLDEGRADFAGRLLRLMAPDDAADLLQAVDAPRRDRLYQEMPAQSERDLRRLAGYGEESAGGLMTTDFLALREGQTVAEATEVLRATEIPEQMHDLPVIDEAGRLVGRLGLRTLLITPAGRRIGEVLDRSVKAIRAELDREAVAREFDRYDLFMLPVVNGEDRLIGIVTVDDVIDIIRQEQTEDVQKTVGAGAGEAVYSPISEKFRGRLPWLLTSLALTGAATLVVLFSQGLISRHPILAFLMPIVAALVGNAGHQALAVTLRGIVLDQVRPGRVRPLVLREAWVGLLNGCGLGLLVCLVTAALSPLFPGATWPVGAVAGASLAVAMCAGTLAGAGIPLIMRGLGVDPARSSTIFLIMVTDGTSFATFLGLAHLASRWL